jgi:serine/threonine-protein kinase HipA
LFNFLICNQDDHAKNFAFLCDDTSNWRLSPFYDVVYSPSDFDEHMTSFNGNGIAPDKSSLVLMARQANIHPNEIKPMVEGLMDNLSNAETVLKNANVSLSTSKTISTTINNKWLQLKEHISAS